MTSVRKTSDIWKHVYIDPSDRTFVICTYCNMRLKYSNKSTSNIKKHLIRKHGIQYAGRAKVTKSESGSASKTKKAKKESPALAESGDCKQDLGLLQSTNGVGGTPANHNRTYSPGSEKKKQLDMLLMSLIVRDTQPLSIVEDAGFRAFVNALDPRYELPGRKELSRYILPQLYEEQRNKVALLLSKTDNISVSTDMWTGRLDEGYLTLTAHFVNEEFKRTSLVLSTVNVIKDHTAANLADQLWYIFQKWGIQEKVQAVVTDISTDVITTVTQELKTWSVQCFANTLNSIVQEAIERTDEISEIKNQVKAVVSFFHHSVMASEKLKETQRTADSVERRLIQDDDTHWNSTAEMLRRYAQEHEAVTTTLFYLDRSDLCVSEGHVKTIKMALDVLEPFELVTEEMCNQRNVTLSAVIPYVNLLQRNLNGSSHSDSSLVQELTKELNKSYSDLENSPLPAMATYLDPRFKSLHFADQAALTQAHQQIKKAYEDERAASCSMPVDNAIDVVLEESSKRKSIWDTHDQDVHKLISKAPAETIGSDMEMRRYEESHYLERHADPLAWWKCNQVLMPHLSQLARKILGIPATSMPPERVFSKHGELLSAKRATLPDSHIDKLLFLNKNLDV